MNKTVDDVILSRSTRGMDKLYNHYQQPWCRRAAEAFLALDRGRVFIYTGFLAGERGETDGPVGAFFLYRGMVKLGWSPLILTDSCCSGYFSECETLFIEKGEDDEAGLREILHRHEPVAHLSIERLGHDSAGQYCNFSGKDISARTPRLDCLFEMAQTPTFAIGDGGNEVGMGNFAEFLPSIGVNPCVVCSDFPIVASVSNWGAYGLLAELERGSGEALLPDFAEVEEYLQKIVSCGAVDGISGENEMSVDGKGYLVDREVLRELRELEEGRAALS
ncbi:MAG: DUF4392 domain-containing protein [Desulforhopalus sp.]|nr:DUF4392 domain-containing protein [Desulforhopalus sp.]